MRVFHKHGVVLLLLLLMLFISGVSVEYVNAAETDTTWQSYYDYSLDTKNNIITLNKYTGSETDLVVYGSAVIDGVEYKTALKSAGSYDGGIWYDKRTAIKVLEFYDPVQLPADCSYMFYECSSLKSLNVSKFDTTGVTNMTGMFYGCSGLTDLNLASFSITTTNCTDLLTGTTGLTLLNTPARTVSSIVLPVSMKELNCSTGALGAETSILASGQSTSKVLVVGTITHYWDISKNNDGSIMAYLFNTGLLYITGNGRMIDWNGTTAMVQDVNNVSTYNQPITSKEIKTYTNSPLYKSNIFTPTEWRASGIIPWAFNDIRLTIKKVVFDGTMYIRTGYMFTGCSEVEIVDFSRSKVTTHQPNSMFYNCSKLYKLVDFKSVTPAEDFYDANYMFSNCKLLTEIDLTNFHTPTCTNYSGMFNECSGLTNLDVSKFDTSSAKNLSAMFSGCSGLTSLDVGNFNTSAATDISFMFNNCTKLASLDLSKFDTSKVTNMRAMFQLCSSLTSLNVSSFNTSKVTNMRFTFYSCKNLSNLDLSSFDMSSVTDATNMLGLCTGVHNLKTPSNCSADVKLSMAMHELKLATNSIGSDVHDSLPKAQTESKSLIAGSHVCDENHVCTICGYKGFLFDYKGNNYCTADSQYMWDISKDQDGSVQAFLFEDGLLYIAGSGELIDWQASAGNSTNNANISTNNTTTNIYVYTPTDVGVYKKCTPTKWASDKIVPWSFKDIRNKITTVYFKGNFSGSAACLFGSCANLTRVDLKEFTGKLNNFALSFIWCSKLSKIDGIKNLDTSNATNMYCMFRACSSLTDLDLSNFDTSKVTNMSNMFYNCSGVTELCASNFNTSKVTDMSYMFYNCSSLSSLDLSSFNTSNVTSMCDMFYDCSGLTSLTVSSFNTSNVTNMSSMFESCSSLTSLDLSNFDTRNVTNIYTMFKNCSSLTSLNVSSFTTSNIPNMSYMFCNCSSLSSLDLSSFDTSNVTYMGYMFQNCYNLSSLDLSSFDTSNVTSMCDMFYDCSSLTSLDLSNFNTGNVVYMQGVFGNCSSLTSLDLSNFDTRNVTSMSSMFYGCSSLTSLDLSNFDTRNVTNMPGMFGNCSSLSSLTVRSFDTSKVNNMIHMFDGCSNLTSLDLSNFDMSKVTNVMYMLTNCTSLHYLKTPINNTMDIALPVTLYEFNKATNIVATTGMTTIPAGLTSSKNLVTASHDWDGPLDTECNICGFQRSAQSSFVYNGVTYNLADALYPPWDISEPHNGSVMAYLFKDGLLYITGNGEMIDWQAACDYDNKNEYHCSSSDNSSITTTVWGYGYYGHYDYFSLVSYTFVPSEWRRCGLVPWCFGDIQGSITKVALDGNFTGSMSFMFAGLNNVETIDFTRASCKPTKMRATFQHNPNTTNKLSNILAIENIDTSNVTDISCCFAGCKQLVNSDVLSFDLSKATEIRGMFTFCEKITSINLSLNENAIYNTRWVFSNCKALQSLIFSKIVSSDTYRTFENCSKLTSLDMSNFDTSSDTNMEGMFQGCSSLTSLDVSKFVTSKVTNMVSMFNGCSKLASLDFSSFNTSNVTTMRSMFNGCSSLISVDVSNFNTSKVTDMYFMFFRCSSLTSLDLSSFNTISVTNMEYTFAGCSKLSSLDLNSFNTNNVTSMKYMFNVCSSLSELDLSNFNMSSVTNVSFMFNGCSSLTKLELSNSDMSKVTNVTCMLKDCSNLTSINLSSFDMSKVIRADEMLTGTASLATLNTPKNCTVTAELPYKMYDIDNVSYTSIPNLTTSIELTKDPKFDYKVTVPGQVVLIADTNMEQGVGPDTCFIGSPEIKVSGSFGDFDLSIKSKNDMDSDGKLTLAGANSNMICNMSFRETGNDKFTFRFPAISDTGVTKIENIGIPIDIIATGHTESGIYAGDIEFSLVLAE